MMGYVLPITHYQYNDYKRRVIKDQQDPFYIEKPYKTIFESHHQDFSKDRTQQTLTPILPHHRNQQTELPRVEKLYADLTGKGNNFNEQI